MRDLVLYAQDEFDRVLESGRASFAMAEQASNRTMRSAIGNLLAPVHYLRGEYAEAKRWADVTLEIGEAIANENAYTTGAALALASRLRLGERVDPAPYVERIETGLRAGGTMQLNTRFVGEALLEAGEVERADRLTADLVTRTGGRLRQALVLTARGDVLARLGRLDEAAPALRGGDRARRGDRLALDARRRAARCCRGGGTRRAACRTVSIVPRRCAPSSACDTTARVSIA